MTAGICLYGHSRSESSFTQVTRGMQRALDAHGALVETVHVDDEREPGQGRLAPISLNCGNPDGLMLAHRLGAHREHWLLLAPNGEFLPPGFPERLTASSEVLPGGLLEGLLAPSRWASEVLKREFSPLPLPVLVAPHGVGPEYRISEPIRERTRQRYAEGHFDVVHMTSTDTERKGTEALLTAWGRLKRDNKLPKAARLHVVIQAEYASKLLWIAEEHELGDEDLAILPGFVLSREAVAAERYSPAHLLCQPSRGEGFGLCPLEARCCGVPVCATAATGHSEHMPPESRDGVVVIPTGENAPMNDFSGSLAPRLEVEDIYQSILRCYETWRKLDAEAAEHAARLAEHWAWENACSEAIRALQARGERHVRG